MTQTDLEVGALYEAKQAKAQRGRYGDPSGRMWSIYVDEAEQYDQALVERWKSDMDGILIFAGLFSSVVTAFIIESYKTLVPDPANAMIALLTEISQQRGNSSTGASRTATTNDKFQPTASALRVNALWFLSLSFALACALSATLIQQWARNYRQSIDHRPAPHLRARIRAYLFHGVRRFNMTSLVDAIPTLLHIALFFFFAGLVEFLMPVNLFISYIVLGLVAVSGFGYIYITFLPTLYRHCPFYSPLSVLCWHLLQALWLLRYRNRQGNFQTIQGTMTYGREMLAMADLPARDERDLDALQWTLRSLTDDSDLEVFLEAIPEFLESKDVDGISLVRRLIADENTALQSRMTRLLLSCDGAGTMPEESRLRHAAACLNAIWAVTVNSSEKPWTSCFTRDTAMALRAFRRDKNPTIARLAVCISAVATRTALDTFWIHINCGKHRPHTSLAIALQKEERMVETMEAELAKRPGERTRASVDIEEMLNHLPILTMVQAEREALHELNIFSAGEDDNWSFLRQHQKGLPSRPTIRTKITSLSRSLSERMMPMRPRRRGTNNGRLDFVRSVQTFKETITFLKGMPEQTLHNARLALFAALVLHLLRHPPFPKDLPLSMKTLDVVKKDVNAQSADLEHQALLLSLLKEAVSNGEQPSLGVASQSDQTLSATDAKAYPGILDPVIDVIGTYTDPRLVEEAAIALSELLKVQRHVEAVEIALANLSQRTQIKNDGEVPNEPAILEETCMSPSNGDEESRFP